MESPRGVSQPSPEELEIREGGGCRALVGLPFVLASVGLILVGSKAIPIGNATQVPSWAWPSILIMGVIFVLVGGFLLTARSWIVLDKRCGLIIRRWGLLVPMFDREREMHEFRAVGLRVDASDRDLPESYLVHLKAQSAESDLVVYTGTNRGDAEQAAHLIGQFLSLPLEGAAIGPDAANSSQSG